VLDSFNHRSLVTESAMPNILPTDIKKFKEAVDWFLKQTDYPATKVKILVELYQAKPLVPQG